MCPVQKIGPLISHLNATALSNYYKNACVQFPDHRQQLVGQLSSSALRCSSGVTSSVWAPYSSQASQLFLCSSHSQWTFLHESALTVICVSLLLDFTVLEGRAQAPLVTPLPHSKCWVSGWITPSCWWWIVVGIGPSVTLLTVTVSLVNT